MCKTISTIEMSREEWLRKRKQGIGGSDAGAICGLNPYSNPMRVYQEKISERVPEYDNEAMRQGRDLEEYVAQRFMEATGLKVRRSNKMYWSEAYPFMFADIDRLVVGEDAGLECKTANAYLAEKWKSGEIPPHYIMQCYHYMAVTGKKSWYLAVVLLGVGFQYVKLEWEEEIIQTLIQKESDFWNHHVVQGVMPEPDGSKICDDVINTAFSGFQKGSEIPLLGFDEKLGRRLELQKQIDMLKTEQNRIEQEIKLYMGEHEKAASECYQVSWNRVETTRLDTARLKAELPEVYKRFSSTSASRRFMVKETAA